MSNELIERLKSYIPSGDGHNSQYANDLADAVAILEAKAAPVGEREAAIDWYNNADWGNECFKDGVVRGFQAGAAHQRQQAREVVMPDVSAMAKVLSDRAADACNINRDDNWAMYGQEYIDDVQAMLEVARLNKGAGSHE